MESNHIFHISSSWHFSGFNFTAVTSWLWITQCWVSYVELSLWLYATVFYSIENHFIKCIIYNTLILLKMLLLRTYLIGIYFSYSQEWAILYFFLNQTRNITRWFISNSFTLCVYIAKWSIWYALLNGLLFSILRGVC